MPNPIRLLVAESEPREDRDARRRRTGHSSGESYIETLRRLEPGASIDLIQPADRGAEAPAPFDAYDAVFLTGSPLHMYEDKPEVRRQLAFMEAVFASGTPAFGSCAGLQVATVAAGGRVRDNRKGHETPFARRITPTCAGRGHPLLSGRPASYDALTVHSDEVEALPDSATLLATNAVTRVQAAEIRYRGGIFWGVQYHPELPMTEVASSLRAQAAQVVKQGLARDESAVESYADLLEELGQDPTRRDLQWQLGVDPQVADPEQRTTELRNFLANLVNPTRTARFRA
jgi:GMP synthase (glutamine-hydrolysing)